MASVESVNVGAVRTVEWRGQTYVTGIFKEPVAGRIAVRGVNLAGDHQADRTVHGGKDKAVYAYAREDHEWFAARLGRGLPAGTFGENLTLCGIDASGASIGERWRIGSALFEVSQPRMPCAKLAMKMQDLGFVKVFTAALRPGAYLRIIEEGDVGAGDVVEIVRRPPGAMTVAEAARIAAFDRSLIPRFAHVEGLAEHWRAWGREEAEAQGSSTS